MAWTQHWHIDGLGLGHDSNIPCDDQCGTFLFTREHEEMPPLSWEVGYDPNQWLPVKDEKGEDDGA